MKKTQQILTLVLSLGFIAVFSALFWILPDADESTVERRHLAKSPALSFSSVASGSFMNDFEHLRAVFCMMKVICTICEVYYDL